MHGSSPRLSLRVCGAPIGMGTPVDPLAAASGLYSQGQTLPHPAGQARLLTDELDLPVAFHVVEGNRNPRSLPVQHGKLTAVGLPGKGYDGFCYRKKGETPLVIEGTIPNRLHFPKFLNSAKGPQRGVETRGTPHFQQQHFYVPRDALADSVLAERERCLPRWGRMEPGVSAGRTSPVPHLPGYSAEPPAYTGSVSSYLGRGRVSLCFLPSFPFPFSFPLQQNRK